MILLVCNWRDSAAQRCCIDWKSHSLVKASKGLHLRALDELMRSGWFVTDLTQAQLESLVSTWLRASATSTAGM